MRPHQMQDLGAPRATARERVRWSIFGSHLCRGRKAPVEQRNMVPILIYHSINEPRPDHVWAHLSLPPEVFAAQMRHIRQAGMSPISLEAAFQGLQEPTTLPRRPVVVTFDDAFLDNWFYALPVLQRYEIPATVFAPVEFIDRQAGVRPREETSPGSAASYGYMSFAELRAMEASGLVRVESHSTTHGEITIGPEIVDFHHPRGDAYWLFWEGHPERKPHWLTTDYRQEIELGTPVFRHTYAMLERRWTPSTEVRDACCALVREQGGQRFFEGPDWRDQLFAAARSAAPSDHDDPSRRESESDYRDRVLADLSDARLELEREMSHEVRFLCWPCGLFNEQTRAWAESAGYVSTLTCEQFSNRPGEEASLLHRLYFGQDERYLRLRTDWLLNLRFRGTLRSAHGSTLGRLMTVAANRSMALVDALHNRGPTRCRKRGGSSRIW